jgi:hypothetical protein
MTERNLSRVEVQIEVVGKCAAHHMPVERVGLYLLC